MTSTERAEKRKKPGLLRRLFGRRRKDATVDATATADRFEAASEPEKAMVDAGTLRALLEETLRSHTAALVGEVERAVRSAIEPLTASLSATLAECSQRIGSLRAEIEETRREAAGGWDRAGEQLRALEARSGALEGGLRDLSQASERLDEHCHEHVVQFQRELELSRDSLDTLRRNAEGRLCELARRHEAELDALEERLTSARRDHSTFQSVVSDRLRTSFAHVEHLLEKNRSVGGTREIAPVAPADRRYRGWRRPLGVLGRPLERWRARRHTAARLAVLERHLGDEQGALGLLRRELHDLSRQAARGTAEPPPPPWLRAGYERPEYQRFADRTAASCRGAH